MYTKKDKFATKLAYVQDKILPQPQKLYTCAHACDACDIFQVWFSGIYHDLTLYVQYTKNQAVKKWLPFELIYAVYLEYIVTIHFVCPYPNLLTFYVQYTKTLPFKKWLLFELICSVYIVTLNSFPVVTCYQSECEEEEKCTPPSHVCSAWRGA